jgi:hypothetical protein
MDCSPNCSVMETLLVALTKNTNGPSTLQVPGVLGLWGPLTPLVFFVPVVTNYECVRNVRTVIARTGS